MPIKYYAVAQGRKTGIFETWAQCSEQVNGYREAKFKSFRTRQEAQEYINTASTSVALPNPLYSSPESNPTSLSSTMSIAQNNHEGLPNREQFKSIENPIQHTATHSCLGLESRQLVPGPKLVNFYAVACGRKTGIFQSWEECNKQVHGYKDAKYKSFRTPQEAREYIQNYRNHAGDNKSSIMPTLPNKVEIVHPNSRPSIAATINNPYRKSVTSSPKKYSTVENSGGSAIRQQTAAATKIKAKLVPNPYQKKPACVHKNGSHSQHQRIETASGTARTIPNLNPTQQAEVRGIAKLQTESIRATAEATKSATKNPAQYDEVAILHSPAKRARTGSELNKGCTPPRQHFTSKIGESGDIMSVSATSNSQYQSANAPRLQNMFPKMQGTFEPQHSPEPNDSNDPYAAPWLTKDIFDRLEQEAVGASQTKSKSLPTHGNSEQPRETNYVSLSFTSSVSNTALDSSGGAKTVPRKTGLVKDWKARNYQSNQQEQSKVVDLEAQVDSQSDFEEDDPLNNSLTQHVLEASRNVGRIDDEETARIKGHMNSMRQVLEKFLKDQGIEERILKHSIDQFAARSSRKPSREFVDSMHCIRLYGNLGCHDNDVSILSIEEKFKEAVRQFKRLEREYSESTD